MWERIPYNNDYVGNHVSPHRQFMICGTSIIARESPSGCDCVASLATCGLISNGYRVHHSICSPITTNKHMCVVPRVHHAVYTREW